MDGSEFLPGLWRAGLRDWRLVFNVPGDPVAEVVGCFRGAMAALREGRAPDVRVVRDILGGAFTRGHFARAV